MRTVCTIEARMRSTRLPGKVLKPVMGKPLLELMVERLRQSRRIDAIVIATTDHPADDPIEALAHRLGVGVFRGSEEDVLDRVLKAGRAANAQLLVETTGDCPLIDPGELDRVVDAFHEAPPVDYCSNNLERTFPRGMDVQVFPLSVLEDVARRTNDPADHEHVSLYIYEKPGRYRLRTVRSGLPPEQQELRLTVDTPEDFTLVEKIFLELYPSNPRFTLKDILALLARRPDLAALNRDIQQKPVR